MFDERLYLVVQALYYVVELIGQRIRHKGPYLTRSTLRRRDLHSKGAIRTGLLESNADTLHRRGKNSLPSTMEGGNECLMSPYTTPLGEPHYIPTTSPLGERVSPSNPTVRCNSANVCGA